MGSFVFIVQEYNGEEIGRCHRICKTKEIAEKLALEIWEDIQHFYGKISTIVVEKYFLD